MLKKVSFEEPLPLLFCLPEPISNINGIPEKLLVKNLFGSKDYPISKDEFWTVRTGRAAGVQAIDMAMNYLSQVSNPYILIGGSDSYCNSALLNKLSKEKRLLTENALSGFVPGEAAGFILLTSSPGNAIKVDDHIVEVCPPGVSKEPGHLYSEEAYKGDGLHQAFALALQDTKDRSIDCIYSSLNGEPFWAKEFGVTSIRNESYLSGECIHKHPIDCLGDLGAATAPVMIGLAALDLLSSSKLSKTMVYSSSDTDL